MTSLKIILFVFVFGFTSSSFSQDVFTTETGEKYHKETCRYLRQSANKVSLKDALQYGYHPCSVCKPPTRATSSGSTTSNFINSTPASSSSSTATQCTGQTQAGNRCKRSTKNANGRCYQH